MHNCTYSNWMCLLVRSGIQTHIDGCQEVWVQFIQHLFCVGCRLLHLPGRLKQEGETTGHHEGICDGSVNNKKKDVFYSAYHEMRHLLSEAHDCSRIKTPPIKRVQVGAERNTFGFGFGNNIPLGV